MYIFRIIADLISACAILKEQRFAAVPSRKSSKCLIRYISVTTSFSSTGRKKTDTRKRRQRSHIEYRPETLWLWIRWRREFHFRTRARDEFTRSNASRIRFSFPSCTYQRKDIKGSGRLEEHQRYSSRVVGSRIAFGTAFLVRCQKMRVLWKQTARKLIEEL